MNWTKDLFWIIFVWDVVRLVIFGCGTASKNQVIHSKGLSRLLHPCAGEAVWGTDWAGGHFWPAARATKVMFESPLHTSASLSPMNLGDYIRALLAWEMWFCVPCLIENGNVSDFWKELSFEVVLEVFGRINLGVNYVVIWLKNARLINFCGRCLSNFNSPTSFLTS